MLELSIRAPRPWGRVAAATVALFLGLLLGTPGGLRADTVLIGAPSTTQSQAPFGGITIQLQNLIQDALANDTALPGRYQQAYDASSFTQKIEIDTIRFFETVTQIGSAGLLGGNTCPQTGSPCGTITVKLGTTTKAVNNLDTSNYDSNLDVAPLHTFVDQELLSDYFSAGAVGTRTLDFADGGKYLYDPALGNLILDVSFDNYGSVDELTQALGSLFFQASEDGLVPVYSSVGDWDNNDNNDFGLLTEFNFNVPEPGTAMLLAGGFAGFGLLRRRRRVL